MIPKIFSMKDSITYDIYVYSKVDDMPFQAQPSQKIKKQYIEITYTEAIKTIEELEKNKEDYEVM